jgi:predicted DNA binding CopG/RHH family protein
VAKSPVRRGPSVAHKNLGPKDTSYNWRSHKRRMRLLRKIADLKGVSYQEYITKKVYDGLLADAKELGIPVEDEE